MSGSPASSRATTVQHVVSQQTGATSAGRDPGLREHLANGRSIPDPPRARVLLRPSGVRVTRLVRRVRETDGFTRGDLEETRADAAGASVHAEDVPGRGHRGRRRARARDAKCAHVEADRRRERPILDLALTQYLGDRGVNRPSDCRIRHVSRGSIRTRVAPSSSHAASPLPHAALGVDRVLVIDREKEPGGSASFATTPVSASSPSNGSTSASRYARPSRTSPPPPTRDRGRTRRGMAHRRGRQFRRPVPRHAQRAGVEIFRVRQGGR